MELIEGIRTNGSARSFADAPVDDATLHAILDDARFAPSGGNRQPWRVAVVRDRSLRAQMAAAMSTVWADYVGARAAGGTPFAFGRAPDTEPVAAPNAVIDDIATVPVVLAIAADLGRISLMDGALDRPPITGGASIYPFCWSILLSARARGLAGVLTTFLSRAEPVAAPFLHLPEGHALAATIFLGQPIDQPTKLTRRPVESFTTVDTFDGGTFHA